MGINRQEWGREAGVRERRQGVVEAGVREGVRVMGGRGDAQPHHENR